MGVEIEFEIEYEPPGIDTVWKVITVHNPPAIILMEQKRSQWEIAASGGNFCSKPNWRWFGRYADSNICPSNRKSWRRAGD